MKNWITSVGIDIGTSTTKLIVSNLRLSDISNGFTLPKFQIVERKLVYASFVYETPLKNNEEIDIEMLSAIIGQEYEKAQLQLSDIKSGAVIITGETATKRNAEKILHYLAQRAGDFVVATAGADLEGILAGKGAGADYASKMEDGAVANVDIGGGTANIAFFERGKVTGTLTFHIGGRVIRLNKEGYIEYISPNILSWLKNKGYHIKEKSYITYSLLRDIAADLSKSMLACLTGEVTRDATLLILGEATANIPFIEKIMFSGGIGELMLQNPPRDMAETTQYGDFGPLLAAAMKAECKKYPLKVLPAVQTVRATVIGAGMQSTEISGATIYADDSSLPIKNLPVIKIDMSNHSASHELIKKEIKNGIETGYRLFEGNGGAPFAMVITGMDYCSYASLQVIADALVNNFKTRYPFLETMVIVCENDMAKALGHSLELRCRGKPAIICIDQIAVENGDYIDIGKMISNTAVPVVIKTLAFPGETKVVKVCY